MNWMIYTQLLLYGWDIQMFMSRLENSHREPVMCKRCAHVCVRIDTLIMTYEKIQADDSMMLGTFVNYIMCTC